jgi:hypothetical protein
MRAKSKKRVATPEATFVFKGVIKKLKATTVTAAPVSDRTCIVTVDQIMEAPKNLAAYAHQDITVELSTRRKVNVGDSIIFHAISWLFGEGLAVRSLYEEAEADGATRHIAAVTRRKQPQTRKHFNDADIVISGKVVEVRLPKSGPDKKKRAAPATATTRVSEHNPKWREAVIKVAEVHKGRASQRQVVIRFPASTDVAWRHAPKFEAGQEGYFMLHASTKPVASRKAEAPSTSTRGVIYTVRDAQDFQPYSESGGIKSIVEPESDSA